MVFRIILAIVEVIALLWSLKSGFLISLLQNVPYIGIVADLFAGFLGFSSSGVILPSQPFIEEFIKALIFVLLYAVLDPLVKFLCRIVIGKHSYHRDIKEAIDRMIVAFLSSILTAIITSLFMEYVYLSLMNWASSFIPWIQYLVSLLSVSVVLVIAFFLFKQTVGVFFLWILTKFIIPTALKILTVEFMVIFLYLLLNLPNMMENVATLVILCIGILCCVGSVFGISVYDHKIDNYWKPGKHGRSSPLL